MYTNIFELRRFVRDELVLQPARVSWAEFLDMCAPMFEAIGVDQAMRDRLSQYSHMDGRTIDAHEALKALRVVEPDAPLARTLILLQQAQIIHACVDGALLVTRTDLIQTLLRSGDDRFADYVSLKLELMSVFHDYQIMHDDHHSSSGRSLNHTAHHSRLDRSM